jgi:hypothetical protein
MSKENKKTKFSVFPVQNLFAVYLKDGKQFKTKVQAVASILSIDDRFLSYQLITSNEIREGLDLLNQPDNFVGILDENEALIELEHEEFIK